MRFVTLLAGTLLLAGCQTDEFCRTNTAATFAPTAQDYARMSATERQRSQQRFNEAARRCGWEP
jgi:uncharacterized lipoprotein YajG